MCFHPDMYIIFTGLPGSYYSTESTRLYHYPTITPLLSYHNPNRILPEYRIEQILALSYHHPTSAQDPPDPIITLPLSYHYVTGIPTSHYYPALVLPEHRIHQIMSLSYHYPTTMMPESYQNTGSTRSYHYPTTRILRNQSIGLTIPSHYILPLPYHLPARISPEQRIHQILYYPTTLLSGSYQRTGSTRSYHYATITLPLSHHCPTRILQQHRILPDSITILPPS